MSGRFQSVFHKLQTLQESLQTSVDRIRRICSVFSRALDEGQRENDFLPRRLAVLQAEERKRIESLLREFSHVVTTELDSIYFALTSREELDAMAGIRRTIRYVRNAFSQELPLGATLERLNRVLTSASK